MSDDPLEHHGIKGQKWGVRRNLDETSGGEFGKTIEPSGKEAADRNEKSKAYMAIVAKDNADAAKLTPAQVKANLAANKEKFVKKFSPDQGEHKGLTPTEKKSF